MLVRFWVNHHLLDLVQRPLWRVVKGRSRAYVQKILAGTAPSLPRVQAASPAARQLMPAARGTALVSSLLHIWERACLE